MYWILVLVLVLVTPRNKAESEVMSFSYKMNIFARFFRNCPSYCNCKILQTVYHWNGPHNVHEPTSLEDCVKYPKPIVVYLSKYWNFNSNWKTKIGWNFELFLSSNFSHTQVKANQIIVLFSSLTRPIHSNIALQISTIIIESPILIHIIWPHICFYGRVWECFGIYDYLLCYTPSNGIRTKDIKNNIQNNKF